RGEQRMRTCRLRLEFRMKLNGEVPRMAGEFGDLDELAVGGAAGNPQPVLGQRPFVEAVEFVPVPMALVNQGRSIHALRERTGRQLTGVAAQAHGAAKVVHAKQIPELVN